MGGRRRTLLQDPPSGLALRPRVLPEGAGTEPIAAAGLPTQEICWSFQGCNAKPPSSPWRDIHTPPAPYAACALTQGLGTGSCHLLCHTPGHKARERQGEACTKQNPGWDRCTGKNTVAHQGARQPEVRNQPLVPGPGGVLAHAVHRDGAGSGPLTTQRAMGKVAPTRFCHGRTCNAQKTQPADWPDPSV